MGLFERQNEEAAARLDGDDLDATLAGARDAAAQGDWERLARIRDNAVNDRAR